MTGRCLPTEILRCVIGSRLHGTNGLGSDRDELWIVLEPAEAREMTHLAGVDIDGWGLRAWCAAAFAENLAPMHVLWAPPELVETSEVGKQLRERADLFVSRSLVRAVAAAAAVDREILTGARTGAVRPGLVERYGFDTKRAGHMIRLFHQAIELARTGRLTLPMPPAARQEVQDARAARTLLPALLDRTRALEDELSRAERCCELPPFPDYGGVARWLATVYP